MGERCLSTYLIDQFVGRKGLELFERVGEKASKGGVEMRAMLKGFAWLLVENCVHHPELLKLVCVDLGKKGGKAGRRKGGALSACDAAWSSRGR